MKNKDFIFTGLQPWDIPIGSNAVDIAREVSRNNRVLYVNRASDIMTLLRSRRNIASGGDSSGKIRRDSLRRITDSLFILDLPITAWSVNGLPDGPAFDLLNWHNNLRTFRFIRKIAAGLHFNDPVHFIDNDIYRSFYSREILKPSLSVYYRRDNLLPFTYWRKHAVRLEPGLIAKSDLVVCNSPQLASFAKQYNPESYDVGQGVDLSAYDPDTINTVPSGLAMIPEPRIGYIGDINSMRLDADLICRLAQSRPDYSFVLIGTEDMLFRSHALHSLGNVYFPGRIPKDRVPEYISALTVCLNPQILNEVTAGNYPRKVDEYLAMGKPVVATRTGTMELFREHAYLCSSLEEYQQATDAAIREDNIDRQRARISFARSHSWQNSVNRIYDHINDKIKS